MDEVNQLSPSSNLASDNEVNKVKSPHSAPPASSSHRFRVLLFLSIILVILGSALFTWYFNMQLQKKSITNSISSNTTNIAQPTKLIIGTDPTLPPMEYIENGMLTGYDIDFAYFMAKELGAQVEFKNIGFDNLFPAIEQKQIDMIISAVTITDERKQKYGFSDPYLNAGQVIITKKTTTDITSTTNLSGKKVGVQQGTTNETEALKYTKERMVIRFKDFEEAAKVLEVGNIDAIITDLPNAKGIVSKNKAFKIASDPFTFEYYGIVFRKDNTELITKINKALAALHQKGILEDLKQKWFQ